MQVGAESALILPEYHLAARCERTSVVRRTSPSPPPGNVLRYAASSRSLSVSQTITGPNATTVYTTQFFNTVDSITFNANVTSATNVGTGNAGVAPAGAWGVTNWFVYDFFTPNSALTVQAKVIANTVNYSLEVTLDDIITTPEASLTLFNPIAGMTNATTNQIGNISFPIRYARLKFNNATTSAGSLTTTFLQQGLQ